MSIRFRDVTVTTDSSGAGTAVSAPMPGVLQSIVYTKTDFADGGTVTVTSSYSGATVWRAIAVNASTTVYPMAGLVDNAGSALSTYGQHAVTENLRVVVSGSGSAKSGSYRFVYEDR